MIKNLLYSLFLHFLLISVIYANFNLRKTNETKTSEIAVSLIAMTGSENSNILKPAQAAPESKEKEEPKAKDEVKEEAQAPKKSAKNEVKKDPKKLARAKPVKSIDKPKQEEKIEEFKREEKADQKQEEAARAKEDKTKNDNQDEEQNEKSRKEKDSGAKKEAESEKEEEKPAADKAESSDMANNMENMDLSAREKFNIQSQLKRCYRRALDESKLRSKIKVMVKVKVSEEGYIESGLEDMIDEDRYNNPNDPGYKIAIDNVRRAIDLCSPLRNLPLDKYDIWKDAIFEFDEEKLRQDVPH